MAHRSNTELVAHVVWAVKLRSAVLDEADDVRRSEVFAQKASELGGMVLAAGCASDHVHVLVRYPASVPLSKVVQRMKGASSRAHDQDAANTVMRWQNGYWARSCAPDDLEGIRAYVLHQRDLHRSPCAQEDWEAPDDG